MAFDANDLSPHEHFVVERTRLGEIADFSPLGGADGSRPGIRAGFLRKLMLGLDSAWRSSAPGVRIRGARIDGVLDLTDCSGERLPALTLECCAVADRIDISRAHIAQLALIECTLRQVAARGARVDGDLDFFGAAPGGPPGAETLLIDARDARIGGSVRLDGAKLSRGETADPALALDGARIGGELLIGAGFEAFGAVHLTHIRCDGALAAENASLLNRADDAGGAAVDARGARFGAGVRFTKAKAEGALDFSGAEIGADCELGGASLRNEFGVALSLAGAAVAGRVSGGAKIAGQLRLEGATIAGAVDLRGVEIAHPSTPRAETFGVAIEASGARMAGLRLEGANIKGQTRLAGAEIGGCARFGGGRFINGGAVALSCADADIAGDVTFAIADGYAPHGQKTVLEGCGDFRAVRIRGDLMWRGLELRGPSQGGDKGGILILTDAAIAGALQAFALTTHQGARLDLTGARCSVLADDVKAGWGGEGAALMLDGFTYTRFGAEDKWRSRLAWLRRARSNEAAYRQAARAYGAAGQQGDARRLLLAGRDAMAARETPGPFSWLVSRLYGLLAGYGLSPVRMVRALVLFFAVGLAGVLTMNAQGALVTAQGRACNAAVEPALYVIDVAVPVIDLGQEARCAPGRTARADLPAGMAVGEDDWRVFEGVALWRWAYALYALLGAILTVLAVITFSGAAARRR